MNYLIKDFFSFPETINDVSARLVALFIVIITSVTIFFIMKESIIGIYFCFFLTYGFLARTLSGPKISPIALVVTKLMVPNLGLKETTKKICSINWFSDYSNSFFLSFI